MYTGELKAGGQTLNVVFDTGSADLWVLSKKAWQDIGSPKNFDYYDPGRSDTAGEICCHNWEIRYGSGEVIGYYVQDTIEIASYSLPGKKFAMAEAVSQEFANRNEPTDGICGFAIGVDSFPGNLAVRCSSSYGGDCGKVRTVTQAIGNNPDYFSATPPVSFFLTPDEDITSRLVIGDPDPDLHTTPIAYVPVEGPTVGMWYVKMVKALVSHDDRDWVQQNGLRGPAFVLIDTGTSFIGVPDQIYDGLLEAITKERTDCKQQRDETFKCGDSWAGGDGINSLSFYFQTASGDSVSFTLEGKDLVIPDATIGIMKAGGIGCSNCWIVGDTFINKHYIVFDEANNQIGFSEATVFEGAKFTFVVLFLVGVILLFAGAYFSVRCWEYMKSRRSNLNEEHNLRNYQQQMIDARQNAYSNMSGL